MATQAFIQQAYLAYLGRPADSSGSTFYANKTNLEVLTNFSASPEAVALYGTGFGSSQINAIYLALFGRSAEAAGVTYWSAEVSSGRLSPAAAAMGILTGAQNADKVSVTNKLAASAAFTAALDTNAEIMGYSGDAAATSGRNFLNGITTTAATQSQVDAAVVTATTTGSGGGSTGTTFTLTTSVDNLTGTSGNDTFNGTYNAGVATDTFGFGGSDTLAGGAGTDTLNIDHLIDGVISPPDSLWSGISGIEKIVVNTSGSGAQTFVTGANFQTAFAAGVDFATTTAGVGAITINMDAFTGAAKVATTSTAGAIIISGANFTQLDVITTGAGAQTITSTGAGAVKVNTTSQDGATTITTGAGNDTLTLVGTTAGGLNNITAGKGADAIVLYSNFSSVDTINQGNGDSKASTADTTNGAIVAGQTLTFGNGLDVVTNFNAAADKLNVGTGGAAVTGLGLSDVAFTATKTIFFSGSYAAGTGVFTIAANGAGADTLILDTTDAADRDVATADTWIVLVGTNSAGLLADTFV